MRNGGENSHASEVDYFLYDQSLCRRFEESKPPVEAFRFFPSSIQTVEYDEKQPKKVLRRVFEGKCLQFLEVEDHKYDELHEEIRRYNSKKKEEERCCLPRDYKKEEVRRFLQATGFNSLKTIELLKENVKWRRELIPPKMSSKVIELLNCGFMYVHGRDNNYRPILVLNAKVYMKRKDDYAFEDWLSSVIVLMEYMIKHLVIPGQVENWNIITDLTGVNLLFFPADMKKLMGILQANYRCRLYVNYLLGMGAFLKGIWSMIKGMLDDTTVRKVRILDDKSLSEIFTFIREEQVEQRFGGRAPNVVPGENNCFPPIMPSRQFLKPDQQQEELLISEEAYKQKHLENELTVTSDFYIRKWEEENQKLLAEKQRREKEKREAEEKEKLEIIKFEEASKVNVEENIVFSREHNLDEEIQSEMTLNNITTLQDLKRKLSPKNLRKGTKDLFNAKNVISDKSPIIILNDKGLKSVLSGKSIKSSALIQQDNSGKSTGFNHHINRDKCSSESVCIGDNEKIVSNFEKNSTSEVIHSSRCLFFDTEQTVLCHKGCSIY